jgi:hypothetical protein
LNKAIEIVFCPRIRYIDELVLYSRDR